MIWRSERYPARNWNFVPVAKRPDEPQGVPTGAERANGTLASQRRPLTSTARRSRVSPWLAFALALVASPVPARAQVSAPAPAAPLEFLSRFGFYVSMEHLVSNEERFVWDANFGGSIDLLDYGIGRATFVANYQTILGSEFRAFDPNQGNYILAGSLSADVASLEFAGVFHHVSRHLSDRPKRHPVDWNMVGGRISRGWTSGRLDVRARGDLRGVVQKTFVDYRWETDADVRARWALSPRVGALATGGIRVLGVDGTRGRGTQNGFRGEGGVRLEGRGAAMDLFAAVERRIDPYQLEFSTATWILTGFRLSSR